MEATVRAALLEAQESLAALLSNQAAIEAVCRGATAITATLKKRGRVFSCGNGGSMCDAMHFAEELSGRFRRDRAPLAVGSSSGRACSLDASWHGC